MNDLICTAYKSQYKRQTTDAAGFGGEKKGSNIIMANEIKSEK